MLGERLVLGNVSICWVSFPSSSCWSLSLQKHVWIYSQRHWFWDVEIYILCHKNYILMFFLWSLRKASPISLVFQGILTSHTDTQKHAYGYRFCMAIVIVLTHHAFSYGGNLLLKRLRMIVIAELKCDVRDPVASTVSINSAIM